MRWKGIQLARRTLISLSTCSNPRRGGLVTGILTRVQSAYSLLFFLHFSTHGRSLQELSPHRHTEVNARQNLPSSEGFTESFEFVQECVVPTLGLRFPRFGRASIGSTLLFTSFMFPSLDFGARVYGGHPNVKGFFEYGRGFRLAFLNNWLLVEDSGSGFTSINTEAVKFGLTFSWGRFERSHLSFGMSYGGVQPFGDDVSVQYLTDMDPEDRESLYLPGYHLEYKKDHNFNFYVDLNPRYPFSGERRFRTEQNDTFDDGAFYFGIGFHRSVDSFFSSK